MHRMLGSWKWLPTFRAVAEQQHLTRAAKQLGVRPSAVSRMLRLLEADLGQPLFARVGRNIQLNPAGEQLLQGVRSAMRLVDDSLSAIAEDRFVGPLYVASSEPVTRSYLLPALDQLRREHPHLVPWVQGGPTDQASGLLLRGGLDLAIRCDAPPPRAQLEVVRLGSISAGIYAGQGHPLGRARKVSLADVLAHPFVHHQAERSYGPWWPAEYRRQIAISVPDADLAAELCSAGQLLAALPEVVASQHGRKGHASLRPLAVEVLRPIAVYAERREQLDLPGPAEALIAALRQQFAAGA